MRVSGRLAIAIAMLTFGVLLALPGGASAAIPGVLDGEVECEVRGDGVRFCGSTSPRSTATAWDEVPIDVNVAFPPEPGSGPDGNYPLVMLFHGYGGSKIGIGQMQHWLDKGYATFSMTDRGFRESCGSPAAKAAGGSTCDDAYVRLIDNRYEVRDAQEFAGTLADEDLIDPQRIGATGGSYGGGMSIALAALRDRKVLPNGQLVPWTSPDGKPMRIAAATPTITWSDLAYSLVPNGSTLDYVTDSPYRGRFGVMKQSLVNGLYTSGQLAPGFYAPEGSDPSADLTGWRSRLLAGEPYDGQPDAEAILGEITSNHSAYYIDASQPPAPMLLANGWTDDLFPVDEMVRYYNRTKTQYPNAALALFASEIAGHPRSQAKSDVLTRLSQRHDGWFDHYVKGTGPKPPSDVETYRQTCPSDASSGERHTARSWAGITKAELRLGSTEQRTIAPNGGSDAVAAAFNPVSGGGACVQTPGADQPGTASYRFPPTPAGGVTLMGSPTVIADFTMRGTNSQVAARLLDVAPDGQQRLVARGLWRPESGRQVFQMHPNGWRFGPGHVVKVELLPADADSGFLGAYGRRSNGQQPVDVANVEIRIPVVERPGSSNGFVKAAAERFLPEGYELARDFARLPDPQARLGSGPLRLKRNRLRLNVSCPAMFDACTDGRISVRANGKRRKFGFGSARFALGGGESRQLGIKVSKRARKHFRKHRGIKAIAELSINETAEPRTLDRRVRRVGKKR
jgi:predicted acyl esterase